MKKSSYIKLFVTLPLFMAVCLFATALSAQEDKSEGAASQATEDGRKMSREAQDAMYEAQRRWETNPEDLAAVRQPIIDFLKAPVEPIPDTLYQMLGQFWYMDEKNDKHIEEAQKIYKAGWDAFPEDDGMLLNYAVTTYELERVGDAAPLFEKYYELNEKHEIKYLEYAAGAYYAAENLAEAKRVYLRMIGLVDLPESRWLDSLIYICQAREEPKDAEKYIKLALTYYPMEKKYWKLLAQTYSEKEDFKGIAAAYEIATRIEAPKDKSEWRTLIDLYNYIGLPLRTAQSIQTGMGLLVKESTEEEQQLQVADAYNKGERVDKAVAYLDSIIAKNPSNALLLKKATILYEARRNKEALTALDECIAANARAYDAYYMKGWVAWDMNDWKMAKEAFENALLSKEEIIKYNSSDALDMLESLDKAKSE